MPTPLSRCFAIASVVLALTATDAAAQTPARVPRPDTALVERAALSRAKGAESATVTVVELSDFQCPFCREFARSTLPALDSAYVRTGKVRLVFHNLPLPNHPAAWAAAEAALCAGAQDAFWPMHDRLFEEQPRWSAAARPSDEFERYAQLLGLDAAAFRDCVQQDRVAPVLVGDLLQVGGARYGTPTFVLIRQTPGAEPVQRVISGAQPFAEFQKALEELLR